MQYKETGHSAYERPHGNPESLNYEAQLSEFSDDIKRYASRYAQDRDPEWQKDFYQEGSMALNDACQKFIILPQTRDFRPYALKAIKLRMIDFRRKTFDRAPVIADNINFTNDDFEEEEYIYNVTDNPEFFSSMTFDIDYQIIFASDKLKASGFTAKEVDAFYYYTIEDRSITDIADRLDVSVGQASKIVSSVKEKSQEIIARSFN